MPPRRWAILTGEYPPQPGGVSDYTRLIARGLAAAGDDVHVWAPAYDGLECDDPGVRITRLPGNYGARALIALARGLAAHPADRLLVQYVPTAFGMRSMNVPFCLWLLFRGWEPIWTMFHEVAFPWVGRPIKLNVLAAVNRLMAWLLVGASERVLVSIPAWEKLLTPLNVARRPVEWAPVPSNLPTTVDAGQVAALRERLCGGVAAIIGHFGSFHGPVLPMIRQMLPPLLRLDPRRVGLLLGRGGEAFAQSVAADHPDIARQLRATGPLSAEAAAMHLAACDVMLQPFPDGASSRRSSLMAGLALGAPIVTTRGPLTEPLWDHGQAVAMTDSDDLERGVRLADELLKNAEKRIALAARAKAFYAEHFGVERTIALLRKGRG